MEENTTPVQPKAEEKPKPTPEEIANAKKKRKTKTILWIIFIIVIILIPTIIYFVKQCEIKQLKETHQKEIADTQKKAMVLDSINNTTHLITVTRVLSWALRSEATRANFDQADQYITELVKTKGFKQIVMIAEDGKVILSTDKKYEGESFLTLFTDQVIGGDNVKIIPQKNGDLMASAPVMGMDKRLGTVVITYAPSNLEFTDEPEK